MSSILTNLKPALLWKHFDEIRKIPHCSKSESLLGDYIIEVAKKTGHKAKRDRVGSIVVDKLASPGHENAETVILQGHIDMVCEKNSDVEHDFSKDPIEVEIDGEWVTAKGTTLGADNGIGVAAALAVLEDDSFTHGPLEFLFTVDEETGLTGANAIEPDFLRGKTLLNLDSEEEGAFFVGCAGGGDSEISLPISRKSSSEGKLLEVVLTGLRGGHSGIDIHTGRGNAVQLLAGMLFNLDVPFELIGLEGGSKHNAIPREASARIVVPEGEVENLKKVLQTRFDEIKFEYKAVEKDMILKIDSLADEKKNPMDEKSKDTFLALLVALPHGVIAMSQEIPDLVETSNNLAVVRCEEDTVKVYTSSRSSIASALEATRTKVEAVGNLAGAVTNHLEGYPAWTPNLESPLLETMKKIYRDLTGKEPEVKAIHAGLECGIIGEKFPGMDMISFGPDLRHPHSPDEKVHIGSVERFWNLIVATLKALA